MTPSFPYPSTSYANATIQNPVQRMGMIVLLLELFITYSRVLDVTFWYLHIPLILYVITVASTVVTTGLFRAFSSRSGVILYVFTAWVGFCTAFSIWKGGSLPVFKACFYSATFFLFVYCLVNSTDDVLRVMRTLAYAVLVGAVLSFFFGKMEQGRLRLFRGSFGDPNEYAMTLLLGLPFWFMIGKHSARNPFKLALVAGAVVTILVAFFRTGSRGGLIGLASLMIAFFFYVSFSRKVLLVITALLVGCSSYVLLPEYLKRRYFTFFQVESVQVDADTPVTEDMLRQLQGGDVGSSVARLALLKQGVIMTLTHPVTGVGPGMFPLANFEEARKRGARSSWAVNHNTFLQVSSETGIPGFLLFVAALVMAYRSIDWVWKLRKRRTGRPPEEVLDGALFLKLSFISMMVSVSFLSMNYSAMLFTICGLAAAMKRTVETQFGLRPAPLPYAAAPPPPWPAPPVADPSFNKPRPRPSSRWGRTQIQP